MRASPSQHDLNRTVRPALAASELGPVLQALARRLCVRDGVFHASRTLWLPLLVSALVLAAGRLTPIEHLAGWAVIPPALWAGLVVGWALLRPLPAETIARRADALLELKERLSTAVALRGQDARGILVDRQWNDAVAAAADVDPRRDIGLALDHAGIQRAVVAAAAVAVLLAIGNPMDQVLEQRAAARVSARKEAEQVEALRAEVAEATTPTSEERAQALHTLAELARQLRANPGSPEQALADIARAEDVLRGQRDPQADAPQASLTQLAQRLASLAATSGIEEAAAQSDGHGLAQALAALPADQQQAAADQLERLASTLTATSSADSAASDLAHALQDLTRTMRGGDRAGLEERAAAVGSALVRAQREQALQQALERVLAQLQRSREAIAGAAQSSSTATARAAAGSPAGSTAQRQTQSQPPGPGRTGGAGGTSARQLPPSSRSGRANDPSGSARAPGVGELERIYAPRIEDTAGDLDTVHGIATDAGESQIRQERQPLPSGAGAARVPYAEVFPAYRDAASAIMEREYVPPGLRDYVKDYFSRLDPGGGDAAVQDEQ